MSKITIFAIVLLIVILLSIPAELRRRRNLNKYWARSCTGKRWKTLFPDIPKDDIRDFLEQFVDGFAFSSKKRLKFEPDDKVMEVYQSIYPQQGFADALELETFAINLEKKYGLKLENILNSEITLGQIFKLTRD